MHQYVSNNLKTHDAMSRGVLQAFILEHNFTKNSVGNAVRPPTIGEETDLISVGGRSSHSSVSEKSEVSTATPRRFDVDLGYEPEGSAPLPAHDRWKQSLYNMLLDSEGIAAFGNFLKGQGEENILECWLALKGFRDFFQPRSSNNSSAASSTTGSLSNRNAQPSEEISSQKLKLAKRIFKTYLATSSPKFISTVKQATKQYILTQIKAAVSQKNIELDSDLFVQSQTEIELNLEATSYKSFLASKEFAKLSMQQDGSTPQSTLSQSPLSVEPVVEITKQPITGSSMPYLPRLDEDQIWSPSQKRMLSVAAAAADAPGSHTDNVQPNFASNPAAVSRINEASDAYPYFTPGAAYWVPPASAIGSDQASKSSDATSDTLSFTDNSSMDGYTCTRQGQKRLMRNQIKKNPTNALPECEHVQRTSRMKDIPNLATKDPVAFFKILRDKLLRVLEERKMIEKRSGVLIRRPPVSQAPAPQVSDPMASIKNVEEDMDEVLESHLQRVMHSPGGRFSPVMKSKTSRPPPGAGFYPQQPPLNQNPTNFGVVPGMPQNEVPDVATPVIPVDKARMISAWIQTPTTQQAKIKKKPLVMDAPSSGHYVHPAESTGLQGGAGSRKMQLLVQDPNMPPFDLPDAGTTIEEVKRRLMEETDKSYDIPVFKSLDIAAVHPIPSAHPPSTSQLTSTSSLPPSDVAPSAGGQDPCTDSDTSSETATLSNINNTAAPIASKPAVDPAHTLAYYHLPHESVPYRIKIPHNPLTLQQFKAAIPRKGKYRYYFRQYSVELKRPVFFEVSKDDEILPRYEGVVVAKVDPCPL